MVEILFKESMTIQSLSKYIIHNYSGYNPNTNNLKEHFLVNYGWCIGARDDIKVWEVR